MSTPPLVEVDDVARVFTGGSSPVRAVDDVSFDIAPGEALGLVGESGSGKSTLSRLVLGLDTPTSGSVRLRGEAVHGRSGRAARALRGDMQIVFQDPVGSLNRRKTIEQILMAPLQLQGADRRDARARVPDLLEQVGLRPQHARRRPGELSGGQCQRVGIARALSVSPSFVVLDEAVSSLDASVQAQILNLLRRLQEELGLTYLFVTHDLAVVRYMTTRIAVMRRGQIVEIGPRDQLFREPSHEYTRELLAAMPRLAHPGARAGRSQS